MSRKKCLKIIDTFRPAFLRMRTIQWYDIRWSTETEEECEPKPVGPPAGTPG
ncbi:MAG: methane monooxygenase/ammonia monooxygenase subunit B, partial [Candidatus Udaeobacter sp.]